MIIKTKKKNS